MSASRPTRRERLDQADRDQARSVFAAILKRLLLNMPGARAAILVDADGESVDYAGLLDPFEIKVIAAHWQIVIDRMEAPSGHVQLRQISIRAQNKSFIVRKLEDRYVLVVALARRGAFPTPPRALDEAHARLRKEAGWEAPGATRLWHRVEVSPSENDAYRPEKLRVAARWRSAEVLGTMTGLSPAERGYQVRLDSGAELGLVRERFGAWYADQELNDD